MEYLRAAWAGVNTETTETTEEYTLPSEKELDELGEAIHDLTVGEKGETAFVSLGDRCLDLFGTVTRHTTVDNLVTKFLGAWNENSELCLKTLFNFRDIRGGKGERWVSNVMMILIKQQHPNTYSQILPSYVELGYWKDICYLAKLSRAYGITDISTEIDLFANQLTFDIQAERPTLCAKWAPSEGSAYDFLAAGIRKRMQMKPRQYRKTLSGLRAKINLIETQMSQGNLDQINFGQIPSKAHLLYRKALGRETNSSGTVSEARKRLAERYKDYLEKLEKGEEKANFKGIMPHELVLRVKDKSGRELIENQWSSLRDDIKKSGVFERCVSIVDVSGSMTWNKNPRPIDVAVSLGILMSECAVGPFAHKVITFHERPEFVSLDHLSSLYAKNSYVRELPWGGSTNLEAVFDQMIQMGRFHNLTADQMPERMFIFTDMQFDEVSGHRLKTFDKIAEKFENAGYQMPLVICWNLDSGKAVPFRHDDNGVCLLSGFSPELLRAVMAGDDLTPMGVYLNAVEGYKIPTHLNLRVINPLAVNVQRLETAVKQCNSN